MPEFKKLNAEQGAIMRHYSRLWDEIADGQRAASCPEYQAAMRVARDLGLLDGNTSECSPCGGHGMEGSLGCWHTTVAACIACDGMGWVRKTPRREAD
jgi:hypothetical protein